MRTDRWLSRCCWGMAPWLSQRCNMGRRSVRRPRRYRLSRGTPRLVARGLDWGDIVKTDAQVKGHSPAHAPIVLHEGLHSVVHEVADAPLPFTVTVDVAEVGV